MSDDVSLTRIESSMIGMRGTLDDFRAEQERRWQKIEPVILARFGELERMRNLERDLNHLGEKHRQLESKVEASDTRFAARASDIEKRQDRAIWLVMGAFGVLQFLWILVQPWFEKILGG